MVKFLRHPVFGDTTLEDELPDDPIVVDDDPSDDNAVDGDHSVDEDASDDSDDDDLADDEPVDESDTGSDEEPGDDEPSDDSGSEIVVLPGKSKQVTITIDPETGARTIENPAVILVIEKNEKARLDFEDGTLDFDADGHAGKAYRLYEAAFDRDPDPAGLGFWVRHLEEGDGNFVAMAALFLKSEEFQGKFGALEDDEAFVEMLYQNILDRAGEAEGIAYWAQQIGAGADRAAMLANFAEADENKENLASEIDAGIYYV
ncbi:DUF4214 domain-containing protein [Pararhizobium haloflavum]|uniref:DUF4214 domain-containing protein n=1 Tax=Pararhizobium haloflavum TaxID=2037914 RepID=UPI000C1A210D|nr:DUF4214 domain-containing protein [Pararhizobium haloflavum]